MALTEEEYEKYGNALNGHNFYSSFSFHAAKENFFDKYDINVIGQGAVGQRLVSELSRQFGHIDVISNINVWYRQKEEDSDLPSWLLRDVSIKNSQQSEVGLNKIKPQPFKSIHDLRKIVDSSSLDKNKGSITVLATNYNYQRDLNFLNNNSPSNKDEKRQLEYLLETSFVERMPFDKRLQDLTEKLRISSDIFEKIIQSSDLDPRRTSLSIQNIIGANEFGKIMQGYLGNIISVTNDVDLTSHIIASSSQNNAQLISGLSHVDQLRFQEFILNELPGKFNEGLMVPVIGPHNEYLTPVSSRSTINGENLLGEYGDLFNVEIFPQVRSKATRAGHKMIELFNNTAGETANSIISHMKSLMYENHTKKRVIRGSCFSPVIGVYTGLPLTFRKCCAVPDLSVLRDANYEEKKIFNEGISIHKEIIDRLKEKGIFEGEPTIDAELPVIPQVNIPFTIQSRSTTPLSLVHYIGDSTFIETDLRGRKSDEEISLPKSYDAVRIHTSTNGVYAFGINDSSAELYRFNMLNSSFEKVQSFDVNRVNDFLVHTGKYKGKDRDFLYVADGSLDGIISRYDIRTGKKDSSLLVHDEEVTAESYSTNGISLGIGMSSKSDLFYVYGANEDKVFAWRNESRRNPKEYGVSGVTSITPINTNKESFVGLDLDRTSVDFYDSSLKPKHIGNLQSQNAVLGVDIPNKSLITVVNGTPILHKGKSFREIISGKSAQMEFEKTDEFKRNVFIEGIEKSKDDYVLIGNDVIGTYNCDGEIMAVTDIENIRGGAYFVKTI